MLVSSSDFQNNVGKYLDLAEGREIVITRNGTPVARLLGMNQATSFLADKLVGLIPPGNYNDETLDAMREAELIAKHGPHRFDTADEMFKDLGI